MKESLLKAPLTLIGENKMAYRKRMSRKKSRRVFRKYAKSKKVNYRRPVSRGGIRL